MHKFSFARLAVVLLLVLPTGSFAGDISVGHPMRHVLLEAARRYVDVAVPGVMGAANEYRFRVVRLWSSAQYGFLCAFLQNKQGGFTYTDDGAELFIFFLESTPVGWRVATFTEALLPESKSQPRIRDTEPYCFGGGINRDAISDAALQSAIRVFSKE